MIYKVYGLLYTRGIVAVFTDKEGKVIIKKIEGKMILDLS